MVKLDDETEMVAEGFSGPRFNGAARVLGNRKYAQAKYTGPMAARTPIAAIIGVLVPGRISTRTNPTIFMTHAATSNQKYFLNNRRTNVCDASSIMTLS